MATVVIHLTDEQMNELQQVALVRNIDADQAAEQLVMESLVDLMRRALPPAGKAQVIPFKSAGK